MASVEHFDTAKVNYSKIQVNFNEVIKKLHLAAKDYAEEKVNRQIRLENLAFEAKEGNFIGGGDKVIMMVGTDGNPVDESRKGQFLECIKTYVHYFAGEEEEKYVKEENLYPITDVSAVPNMEQGTETQSEENQENNNGSNEQRANESIEYTKHGGILNMLFEADENDEIQSSQQQSPRRQPPQEDKEGQGDGITIGYSVPYNIDVEGKKSSSFLDSIKGKMRGLFGGVLSDLKNIKIKVGGVPVQIGKVLDWDKWREAAGYMAIDISKAPGNIKQAFDKDFPNNDVNTSSIKIWGRKPLITHLDRNGKISPNIKDKINSAQYSIVIDVNSEDPNYPDYSTKSIAETVTKALGTYDNLTNRNKVSQKDVIKINDISGLYKKKSEYEKPKDQTQNQNNQDQQKRQHSENPEKKDKNIKESNEQERSDGTENKQENGKQDEKEQQKNNAIELIQSEEYSSYVIKQSEEQGEKVLKGLGDKVETRYLTNEQCVKFIEENEINNSEFVEQVKRAKENCIITTITKDLNKGLNEGNVIIRTLLEKYDLICEESEGDNEESPKQIMKDVVDTQNPYNDDEENESYKKDMRGMIDSEFVIEKLQKKLQQKTTLAYKNIFLNTQKNFEQIKDVKPQFNMFQTNVELDNNVNECIESYYHPMMKILFEDKGNETPYNDKLEDKTVKDMNNSLIKSVMTIEDKNRQIEGEQQKSDDETTNESKSKKNDGPLKPYKKNSLESMGSRRHCTPYCIISNLERVIEYMKNHGINVPEALSGKQNKLKYCAIIIKKESLLDENGDVLIFGGNGHEGLNDKACQSILDDVVGSENRIDVIKCDSQNTQTMNAKKNELLEQNLGFHNTERVKIYEKTTGKKAVPKLQVWVRPFNIQDSTPDNPERTPSDRKGDTTNINISNNTTINKIDNKSINIDNKTINNVTNNTVINNTNIYIIGGGRGGTPTFPISLDIKMLFVFVMPDPIIIKIKIDNGGDPVPPPPEPTPKPKDGEDDKNNSKGKSDWYIIPHKELKDMKERPHQETHYNDVTTKTKTNNSEYRP